jgi:hypothetical protein
MSHSTHNSNSKTKNSHRRNPPSNAGVMMADATLYAIMEAQHDGRLSPDSTNAGKQYTREETNQLIIAFAPRARGILISQHTANFFNTPHGKQMHDSWFNVPLREVVYALSTAHHNCLRAFRVFKGTVVEWVGDDSHRNPETKETKEIKETKDDSKTSTMDTVPIVPPDIRTGQVQADHLLKTTERFEDDRTDQNHIPQFTKDLEDVIGHFSGVCPEGHGTVPGALPGQAARTSAARRAARSRRAEEDGDLK